MITGNGAPRHGATASRSRELLGALLRRKLELGSLAPLSFGEERMWYLEQLEPGNLAYVMAAVARIEGALRPDVLADAFAAVARRHEILRTGYRDVDGEPRRVVAPECRPEVRIDDLRGLSVAARDDEVRRVTSEEMHRPFDLETPPLLRVRLLRLADDVHAMVATGHHIIFDHWSTRVLHREVMALYEALIDGRPSPLPDLPIQYADFAAWQRRTLRGEALDAHLAYWCARLADAPALRLPTDRPPPAVKTHAAERQARVLPASIAGGLAELGRALGVTTFMVLAGAFDVLLRFYARNDDIVVGMDIANRNRTETEPLIGFFVNQLPLRIDLSGDPTFAELLGRVRIACVEAYAHQDAPFHFILRVLRRTRKADSAPLFQVKLALVRPGVPADTRSGLRIVPLDVPPPSTELDLTLFVEEADGGLLATLDYNADLFAARSAALMLRRLEEVLRAIVEDADVRLHAIDRLLERIVSVEQSSDDGSAVDRARLPRIARRPIGVPPASPSPAATTEDQS